MDNYELEALFEERGVYGRALYTTLPKLGQQKLRDMVEQEVFTLREEGSGFSRFTGLILDCATYRDYSYARLVTQTFTKELLLSGLDVLSVNLGLLGRSIQKHYKNVGITHKDICNHEILVITDFYRTGNDKYFEGYDKYVIQEFLQEYMETGYGLVVCGDMRVVSWGNWWDASFLHSMQEHAVQGTMSKTQIAWSHD